MKKIKTPVILTPFPDPYASQGIDFSIVRVKVPGFARAGWYCRAIKEILQEIERRRHSFFSLAYGLFARVSLRTLT